MSWLDSPGESVVSDGCVIRYRRLGPRGGAPIVLLHGGGAHAGWWLHVAPALARTHDVAVPDLSGHGDSGHRPQYSAECWVADVVAVIGALGAGPVHLAGHSMGGLVALHVAGRHPELVRSLTVVDSAVVARRPPGPERVSRVKYYASQEEGLANFRLRPRATTASPETLAEVGRAGLGRESAGWRWKFDPLTTRRLSREEVAESVRKISCPVSFLYGEHSELADGATVDHLAAMLGREVPRTVVPGAHHHVPLDAPAETVAGIERTVAVAAPDELAG